MAVAELVDGYPTLVYVSIAFPMLMTDCDLVYRIYREQLDESSALLMMISTEHPKFPVREDRVRLEA